MRFIRLAGVAFALVLAAATAAAQPAKSLREQLVGTWSFIIAEISSADGKKTLPFGDKPKGMLIFTEDGHFSQVHVAGGLPKIAGNNRLGGTPEQNTAIVHGTLAMFGTYTVDEGKKTVTFKIEFEHLSQSRRRLADPHDRPADGRRVPQHQPGGLARRAGGGVEPLQAREVTRSSGTIDALSVMAGLVPAIHVLVRLAAHSERRGCPAQGRA